ncbi:hypothetical protein V493_00041 [Pseudogymnoascus sp. VKM F-4281 (FW-2241)]|nr:hypothetical protein V493_00041 [Pseudogymnoascus sp. VKM F-4281 (FW-2241)]
MAIQTLKSEDQGLYATVKHHLDEKSNSKLGSPEFVITMIAFWKNKLERSDSSIARPLVYKCIEALVPFVFEYEGDIQLENIQLALDQITSLQEDLEQDANLPENVQRILKELKCFYGILKELKCFYGILKELECFYGGGAKGDGRVDNVAKVFCRQPAATAQTSRPSFWNLALCYMLVINLWMPFI